MMRHFYFLLLSLITGHALCQSIPEAMIISVDRDCPVGYDSVYNLQNRAYRIFDDSTISIGKKIRLSKKFAQMGLDAGYNAISEGNCKTYSIIVDRMIELASILSKREEARSLALQKIDMVYPEWKDYTKNEWMDYSKNEFETIRFNMADDLQTLAGLPIGNPKSLFYKEARKNKQLTGVCGNVDYDEEGTAQKLLTRYGNIYAFRYLQSLGVNINITDSTSYMGKRYDQLIDIWSQYISVNRMVELYENATIQSTKGALPFWRTEAKHYLQVEGINFYFEPTIKNQYKAHYPENFNYPDPEVMKMESLFYKKLKARL